MARAEPAAIAHTPLVGTNVSADAVLDVHLDDGCTIVQIAHIDQQIDAQMLCREEPPRAIDELDRSIIRGPAAPAQDGNSLAVRAHAVYQRCTRALIQDIAARVHVPDPAVGGTNALNSHDPSVQAKRHTNIKLAGRLVSPSIKRRFDVEMATRTGTFF